MIRKLETEPIFQCQHQLNRSKRIESLFKQVVLVTKTYCSRRKRVQAKYDVANFTA